MKNKLFASVPNILFGALITIAPQTFAHACTGHDMPGACHYSQQAATGIGVVILVFGVVALFVAPQIRIGLNIAAAADALLLLAVPTFLIGICKGAMMHMTFGDGRCRRDGLPAIPFDWAVAPRLRMRGRRLQTPTLCVPGVLTGRVRGLPCPSPCRC